MRTDAVAGAAGLHALVPYFTQLIAEEVQRSLHDLPRLHLLLQVLSWSFLPFCGHVTQGMPSKCQGLDKDSMRASFSALKYECLNSGLLKLLHHRPA